ncbi:carbon storage regulator [Parasporobacterium paucivorans]|uniref:Translational regulator CsrA n=1 Tax=Parasporobacterium paucivorans DSM 15970 TaxID=1122934 RepID=A0A1M6I627_9FIRM|nr:carbon storage regulator [Parasporobacterium paucivorans]SHJ29864.1 carbon storage regulator, CsrA [Parasporobacterium paucivorans DSM 15970]
MLILQRKKGESIVINGNIKVSVVDSGSDWVKLAIDAPKEISIMRSELLEAAQANREASCQDTVHLSQLEDFFSKKSS